MSTIPYQRNNTRYTPFDTALWTAIAVAEGMPAGDNRTPVPPGWFTGDATTDLDRATDLLCRADTALMDAVFTGTLAQQDQARTHVQRLTELSAVLAAVIEAQGVAA